MISMRTELTFLCIYKDTDEDVIKSISIQLMNEVRFVFLYKERKSSNIKETPYIKLSVNIR